MFNKSQPLWLPKGSVRAILAISLVAAVIVGTGGDAIQTLATAVVSFYFGTKAKSQPDGDDTLIVCHRGHDLSVVGRDKWQHCRACRTAPAT